MPQIKSAIPHPKIMGVIRECGGKMHMGQREWEAHFLRGLQELRRGGHSGDPASKYLVRDMLTNSDINPFDSQEAKP